VCTSTKLIDVTASSRVVVGMWWMMDVLAVTVPGFAVLF
jgi:hypothetical protein